MSRFHEIWEEFKSVIGGRVSLVDVILPPLLFTVLNGPLPLNSALIFSLGIALTLLVIRLMRGEAFGYAASGMGVILVAAVLAWITESATSYYLPGILSSGLTTLLCLVSLVVKKPLAAWSSHLTRSWPLPWYWHEAVRPAYSEVTAVWAVFFGGQFALQLYLYLQENPGTLGWVQILTGWPALILLLAGSYLYGLKRLQTLGGPSVEEYTQNASPPWEGQKRGF